MCIRDRSEALEKQNTLLSATQVILHYEESAMKDGFSEATSEGISDIRLIDDWALPGDSLVNDEGPTPKKLVIFYDNNGWKIAVLRPIKSLMKKVHVIHRSSKKCQIY